MKVRYSKQGCLRWSEYVYVLWSRTTENNLHGVTLFHSHKSTLEKICKIRAHYKCVSENTAACTHTGHSQIHYTELQLWVIFYEYLWMSKQYFAWSFISYTSLSLEKERGYVGCIFPHRNAHNLGFTTGWSYKHHIRDFCGYLGHQSEQDQVLEAISGSATAADHNKAYLTSAQ